LLLEHSWPLIEQDTDQRAQRRPSMRMNFEQIMQWPECQQSLAASLARPALPGQTVSPTFWQEIRDLRQSLSRPQHRQRQPQQQQQRPGKEEQQAWCLICYGQ